MRTVVWPVLALLTLAMSPPAEGPQVDFPTWEWMRNVGHEKDQAGMCVFTSFEHAARWAGFEEFRGFRDWCAKTRNNPDGGGGYPEKLYALVKKYCQAKGISPAVFDPDRHLIQYEGPSPEILEAALRNGWLPCVTLYSSPRYGRGTIYHMVNCAHLDGSVGAILDNNFQPLEWASRQETLQRVKLKGSLWCAVLVRPGPPSLPRNAPR